MTPFARNPDGNSDPYTEGGIVMRLRLVGQMQAWTNGGESVLPSGRKTRGVLAVIALSAPRPVLRGRLAEMFWSRRPEEQARASLRQEIHRLLEAIDPLGSEVLAITRDHLALRPGTVWTDVDEVLRATANNAGGLALFDGELLEDLDGLDPAFDAWLAGERERIGDRARMLAEQLMRQQVEPDETIAAAQRLLAIDRAHEGAWRTLMRAYASRGERGMAIQAYERCRTVLMEQLDAEPSSETAALGQELRAATLPGHGAVRPAIVTSSEMARARTIMQPVQPRTVGRTGLAESQTMLLSESRTDTRPVSWIENAEESRAGSPGVGPPGVGSPGAGSPGAGSPGAGSPGAGSSGVGFSGERSTGGGPPYRGSAHVGVMPLRLVGVSDHETHLATGLADEITNALATFRWMSLISSASLARFAAQNEDEGALRRAFGLDFLIDGSVQRSGDTIRLSIRLLDLGRNGQVAWSRRFDRSASDLLAVQDEIAAEVVAQIEPEILSIESQRATAQPSSNPGSYELVMRALPIMARLDRGSFTDAGDLLTRAIALTPDLASAQAWSAYWHALMVSQSWSDDPAAAITEAGRLSERAVVLDPQDARALTIAGHVRASLFRRMREAMTLHDRALRLNPNLAMAWALSATAHTYVGDLVEARRRIDRYKQLSPLDPQAVFYDTARILISLLEHHHEAAVDLGREVTEMNSAFVESQKFYLASLGQCGGHPDTARVLKHLLTLEPGFSIAAFRATTPLQREADRDHVAEGLRRAGVPVT